MRAALCSVLLLAAAAGAAHAHEPLDVTVEVTTFEERGFTGVAGGEFTGYRMGLALTNNGDLSDTVSVWPVDDRGLPADGADFGLPGIDCPPTITGKFVEIPPGERVAFDLCFVLDSGVAPHHVDIVSMEGGGMLLSVITDQADEDLCAYMSSHSHCVQAEFTGAVPGAASDYTVLALMAAIGVGAAAAAVLMARRRRK